MQIEKGKEVLIDGDLSQHQYPMSFRYYDYILNMVQERMSDDRREFYGLKKGIVTFFKEFNKPFNTEKPGKNTEEKLVFQHSVINKK